MQLSYGDDGLDPVCMEGKGGEPIDFERALSQVKADTPSVEVPGVIVPAAAAPLPAELSKMLTERLELRGLVAGSHKYSGKFVDKLKEFVQKQVSCLCIICAHDTCGLCMNTGTSDTKPAVV